MIGAALYVLIVSLFLSAGAWLAERILASLRWPRRSAWIAAMLMSVAIPAWTLPGALPRESPVQLMRPATVPARSDLSRNSAHPSKVAPGTPLARTRPLSHSTRSSRRFWTATVYDRVLLAFLTGWGLISVALLTQLFAAAAALRRRSRHWSVTAFDGTSLIVSDDLGPAVLGIVRPRIIVPRWLLEESEHRRIAVLAHEREHLRAQDGRCLLVGLLLPSLVPWNLPLWWLWRRLRFAIEVDCDARVVRRGVPLASYGESLLAIATRTPRASPAALGIFERQSQLARRIRILVSPAQRWWRWAALPLYAFTAAAALAAVTFPAPPINAALGARNEAHRNSVMTAKFSAMEARARGRLLGSGQPDALAAATLARIALAGGRPPRARPGLATGRRRATARLAATRGCEGARPARPPPA